MQTLRDVELRAGCALSEPSRYVIAGCFQARLKRGADEGGERREYSVRQPWEGVLLLRKQQ